MAGLNSAERRTREAPDEGARRQARQSVNAAVGFCWEVAKLSAKERRPHRPDAAKGDRELC
jgi:hypothetical protein